MDNLFVSQTILIPFCPLFAETLVCLFNAEFIKKSNVFMLKTLYFKIKEKKQRLFHPPDGAVDVLVFVKWLRISQYTVFNMRLFEWIFRLSVFFFGGLVINTGGVTFI